MQQGCLTIPTKPEVQPRVHNVVNTTGCTAEPENSEKDAVLPTETDNASATEDVFTSQAEKVLPSRTDPEVQPPVFAALRRRPAPHRNSEKVGKTLCLPAKTDRGPQNGVVFTSQA